MNFIKKIATKMIRERFKALGRIGDSKLESDKNRVKPLHSRRAAGSASKLQRMREYQRDSILLVPMDEIENMEWSCN
jgi:hypothetical protein